LAFARDAGGPALRALSFAERGAILKGMADALQGARWGLIPHWWINNARNEGPELLEPAP
jgi:putative SOS response-associated peptidase YedK